MVDEGLIKQYNYAEFVPEKFERWMNFDSSPLVGQPAPDFLLWNLDGTPNRLSEVWSRYTYTIVEFGSFT